MNEVLCKNYGLFYIPLTSFVFCKNFCAFYGGKTTDFFTFPYVIFCKNFSAFLHYKRMLLPPKEFIPVKSTFFENTRVFFFFFFVKTTVIFTAKTTVFFTEKKLRTFLQGKSTDFFTVKTSVFFTKNYGLFYREKLRTFLQGKTTVFFLHVKSTDFFTGKNYGLFYREKLRSFFLHVKSTDFFTGKTTDFFTLKTSKLSLGEFIPLSTVEEKGAQTQTCQGNTNAMPYCTTRPSHWKNSTWCSGKYMFSLTITSDTCQHSNCGSRFRMCLNP